MVFSPSAPDMDVCFKFVVIIVLVFVSSHADEYETDSIWFSIDFKSPHNVQEGVKVTLTCPKISNRVYITLANSQTLGKHPVTLIDSSNPTDISNKYSFNETDNSTYAFTINRISREDEGTYTCIQGPVSRTRALTVIYSPSESSPHCSSNYKSPIIFYDEIKNEFVFNCSTERGKPSVTTAIYVNERKVTSDLEVINETRAEKEITTYSLSLNFNDTLQNKECVCNVTQQLPSPHSSYQGSCSFGPLHVLSGFSLSVFPLSVTVREGSEVNLTCTSNVTGVEMVWSGIPGKKYNITKYNKSSELTIHALEAKSNEIFVECSGSYGSRSNSEYVAIFPEFNKEHTGEGKGNRHSSSPFVVIVIVIALILMFVFVPLLLYWNKRRTKKKKITQIISSLEELPGTSNHSGDDQMITATEGTNTNNGNNTTIKSEDGDMIENIIYESAMCSNKTTLGAENDLIGRCFLGDDHLICNNVIYQSVSRSNEIT